MYECDVYAVCLGHVCILSDQLVLYLRISWLGIILLKSHLSKHWENNLKMYVSFVSISFPYFAIDLSRMTSTRAYQLVIVWTLFTTSAKMLVFVFSYTVFVLLQIEVRGTLQFLMGCWCLCMCAYRHMYLHMHDGVKDGGVDRGQ